MACFCCTFKLPTQTAITAHLGMRHPMHNFRASSVGCKSQGDGDLHLQEGLGEKPTSSTDVMRLFNDVQQNMLFLNKQRIDALDDLERVKKEKEVLQAKLSLLEAEVEAATLECNNLKSELQTFKPGWKMQNRNEDWRTDFYALASPILSNLLVRIDSMVLTGTIDAGQASQLKILALQKDIQAAKMFSSLQEKDDKELAAGLLPLLDPNRRFGLHITHICTELDPIARSGAIGKFVLNLSTALQKKGNLVEVILPKYATMEMEAVQNLREIQVDFSSFFGGQWHKNAIWTGTVNGIAVTFIDSLHPGDFFLRDHFYEYKDDFERFSYFSRAALDYILRSAKKPDILHLHDWHTALIAPMFWELFANQGLEGTRLLFTCNNLHNQCLQEPAKLSLCGLDPMRLHRIDRMQDNLQKNLVNIVKGGIVYSNKVTTSSAYMYDTDHGHGLQSTLMEHKHKCVGIFKGLDTALWNPEMDTDLPATYTSENLAGKLSCKRYLKKQLGLSSNDFVPLVGCLAPEQSDVEVELIQACGESASLKGAEFVFMGGSKKKGLTFELEEKGGKILKSWDDSMAHLIMAASDIMVCMAIDEETSELPLIAMLYGSVPIMKEQEGFHGCVTNLDDITNWKDANAFFYRSGTIQEVRQVLMKAIDCKVNDPELWKQVMINGMSHDFSWDGESVQAYLNAYTSIRGL